MRGPSRPPGPRCTSPETQADGGRRAELKGQPVLADTEQGRDTVSDSPRHTLSVPIFHFAFPKSPLCGSGDREQEDGPDTTCFHNGDWLLPVTHGDNTLSEVAHRTVPSPQVVAASMAMPPRTMRKCFLSPYWGDKSTLSFLRSHGWSWGQPP